MGFLRQVQTDVGVRIGAVAEAEALSIAITVSESSVVSGIGVLCGPAPPGLGIAPRLACGDDRGKYAAVMSLGPIRPRFRLTIPGRVEEVIARVQSVADKPESRCVSRVVDNHVDITVVREDRHRWSPCVQLEFRAVEASDRETIVDGLVGPHPNLWTMFACINMTIALVVVFGLMMGVSQLSLGNNAWGMWTVLGGVILLGVMYGASQIGQRLAAEQTRLLTSLVEDALGAKAF